MESKNNCLLIIDVQVGFINDATKHIPNLVESLQVEYTHIYVTRFHNDAGSFYRQLIKWNRFDKNSKDFPLAFVPAEQAVVIDKNVYTCVDSHFLQDLDDKGIESVDICGLETDICVAVCAVDLFEAGVRPRVLGNHCASYAGKEAHAWALKTLARFIGRDQVIS